MIFMKQYRDGLHDDVRVLVVESAGDGLERVLGAVLAVTDLVAEVHDEAPVLRSVLLVRDLL